MFDTVANEAARGYRVPMPTVALLNFPPAALWMWIGVKLGRERNAHAKTQPATK